MDKSLFDTLAKAGVTSVTIKVLENEMILTEPIFYSLNEIHFTHILPQLKVGQHVLLLDVWRKVSYGIVAITKWAGLIIVIN